MNMMAVALLAALAFGGVAYVFLYPVLSGERVAEKRRESVARTEPAAARSGRGQPRVARRDAVEATLKEFEERQKKNAKPSLQVRLAQAGLSWTKQQFLMISAGIGLALFVVAFTFGPGLLPALGIGFAGAFGLPRWMLAYLKKRREQKFLNAFPDAVDIIVRGVKAGLPLLDCLKMITQEAPEPIKSEFRVIVDTQAIGMPLGEACAKLYERTPVAEANFFAIVVGIQQRAGGNLSEALGNLSRVLRDRKKMKAKITAMSQEAKASAGIIGALPICVMVLVYLTSKDYITLLFTESLGHLMLAASAVWMSMGILVMKKMINFDF
jgi:tight adherence protein B